MQYRRADTARGTYFFTVNLAVRSSQLLVDRVADLRHSVRLGNQRHPFEIVAWVVLPDHLHAIWTLPEHDANYATRWMLIKAGFSRRIEQGETHPQVVPPTIQSVQAIYSGRNGSAGELSSGIRLQSELRQHG